MVDAEGIVMEMRQRWEELRNSQNILKATLFEMEMQKDDLIARIEKTEANLSAAAGRYTEIAYQIERLTGLFPNQQAAKDERTPANPQTYQPKATADKDKKPEKK